MLPHNEEYTELVKSYLKLLLGDKSMSEIIMKLRTASTGMEDGPVKRMLMDFYRFIIRVEHAVAMLNRFDNKDNEISIKLNELGIEGSYRIEFFYIAKVFIREAGLSFRFATTASDDMKQLEFTICRVVTDEQSAENIEKEVYWLLGVYTDEGYKTMNEYLLTLPVKSCV